MADPADLKAEGLLRRAIELLRAHPLPLLLPPVLIGLLSSGGDTGPRIGMGDLADPGGVDPLNAIPFYALLAGMIATIVVVLVIALLVFALVVIVTALVYTATTRALLDHLGGAGEPDFGAGFRSVSARWGNLGWTFFLASIVVILGFVAFIVPGFILLSGFLPLFAILAAENATGSHALKRAWTVSKGRKGQLAILVVGGVILNAIITSVLGWIPLLGWLVTGVASGAVTAVWLVAGALVYRGVTTPEAPPPAAPVPPTAAAP